MIGSSRIPPLLQQNDQHQLIQPKNTHIETITSYHIFAGIFAINKKENQVHGPRFFHFVPLFACILYVITKYLW